jgi:uncharacterized RDD family membrane protein YckC
MTAAASAGPATPGLLRRLASLFYDAFLATGIAIVVGVVYGIATQQRHALVGMHGLQATVFVVLGLYFVWCWSQTGQTLPMRTWRIRLLTHEGATVSPKRALARYLAAWIWVLPPLVWAWFDPSIERRLGWIALGWAALYGVSALLHPRRQFWHDVACGTRLVDAPK